MKRLRLSSRNKRIAGVCGGVGEFFGIDPTLLRLLAVLLMFLSWGTVIAVYIICWAVMPPGE